MESPKTNIFGEPIIKITRDMVDLLGGQKSSYYAKFKSYIINVFDILRLYKQLVFGFYAILDYEKLIPATDFCQKLDARFMTGISCKDAEIKLIGDLESSTSSYVGTFADMCHHYRSVLTDKGGLLNLDTYGLH